MKTVLDYIQERECRVEGLKRGWKLRRDRLNKNAGKKTDEDDDKEN